MPENHLDTESILSLKKPQRPEGSQASGITGGPFSVVAQDDNGRGDIWALVALQWDYSNVLGIRWFAGGRAGSGFPPRGSWLILPGQLWPGILASLELPNSYRAQISRFLFESADGNALPEEPPEEDHA